MEFSFGVTLNVKRQLTENKNQKNGQIISPPQKTRNSFGNTGLRLKPSKRKYKSLKNRVLGHFGILEHFKIFLKGVQNRENFPTERENFLQKTSRFGTYSNLLKNVLE